MASIKHIKGKKKFFFKINQLKMSFYEVVWKEKVEKWFLDPYFVIFMFKTPSRNFFEDLKIW